MRKSLVLILCLAFCTKAFPQEKKLFWDGYDWIKVNEITKEYPEYAFWIKSGYLSGLFDGKLFYQLKAIELNNSFSDTLFNDLIKPTNYRSLIAGLDMFYNDAAKRYIPIPLGLIATIMIQQG